MADINKSLPTSIEAANNDALNQNEFKSEIHIGNLPNDIRNEDLTELFSKYGEITRVKIVKRKTHAYGFVSFSEPKSVETAVQAINGTELHGSELKVAKSEPARSRKPRRSFNNYRQGYRSRGNNRNYRNSSNRGEGQTEKQYSSQEGDENATQEGEVLRRFSRPRRGGYRSYRGGRGRSNNRGRSGQFRRFNRLPRSGGVPINDQIFVKGIPNDASVDEITSIFDKFSISAVERHDNFSIIKLNNDNDQSQIINAHKESPFTHRGRTLLVKPAREFPLRNTENNNPNDEGFPTD